MNWDAIGAVAELLGAIGVIGSLLYLAAQIRRSSASDDAKTFESVTNSWHQATANLLDASNRVAFLKGLDGYDALDDDGRFHFHVLVAQILDRFDTMLHFEQLGVSEKGHLSGMYGVAVRDCMSHPGFQAFWRAEHGYFSSTMQAWMASHGPEIDGLSDSGYLARINRSGGAG